MRKKTHEEYVNEVKIINPNVEVIEEYKGVNTKIKHRCLKDRYEWLVSPHSILNNSRCPRCVNKIRRTHTEYVNEVSMINNKIEVVDNFIDTKINILHKCKICNYEWKVRPERILIGSGCPKCANSIKKTHSEYVEELKLKNPNIEIIGEYVNAKTSILHKCLIHNIEWMVSPDVIKHGKGCPKCVSENRIKNNTITHDEYVKRLSNENPSIEVIDEYITAKTKILHHCLIHDVFWEIAPDKILRRKSGCPKCAKEKRILSKTKSREEYISELSIKNPIIELVGDYLGNKKPTQHRCKIHNYIFDSTPNTILNGCGCKYCKSEKLKHFHLKTEDYYMEELAEKNQNVKLIGKYYDGLTSTEHLCLIHNIKWCPTPTYVLQGGVCPQCKLEKISKGERYIGEWLTNHNFEYESQKKFPDCCNIRPLPFDFYLPNRKIAIEYDGKQHYEPIDYFGGQEEFEKRVINDNIKNEYCKNNGISLLRIPYFKNVEEELNNFLFI